MAAYPDLPWMVDGSRIERADGTEAVRATSGALKVRKLYAGEPRSFDLVHWLSSAQRSTLESFYQTNKLLDVTLTDKDAGGSHTVRFGAAPQYEPRVGYVIARVRLLEV